MSTHRLEAPVTAKGERLRVAGQEAVDSVFAASFQALTVEELDRLGSLLETVLDDDSLPQ